VNRVSADNFLHAVRTPPTTRAVPALLWMHKIVRRAPIVTGLANTKQASALLESAKHAICVSRVSEHFADASDRLASPGFDSLRLSKRICRNLGLPPARFVPKEQEAFRAQSARHATSKRARFRTETAFRAIRTEIGPVIGLFGQFPSTKMPRKDLLAYTKTAETNGVRTLGLSIR
jgi:hypothetical protein